jgi:hypothetical protein
MWFKPAFYSPSGDTYEHRQYNYLPHFEFGSEIVVGTQAVARHGQVF